MMPKYPDAKPLIMCPRSTRAWQAGEKGETRRLVRPQPIEGLIEPLEIIGKDGFWIAESESWFQLLDQPHAVGQLLWIREKLRRSDSGIVTYAVDHTPVWCDGAETVEWGWKRKVLPAMFMPRWACRDHARVTSRRPERLQEITDEGALAEGTLVDILLGLGNTRHTGPYRDFYAEWWDELHKKPGTRWDDNSMVWVYGIEPAEEP